MRGRHDIRQSIESMRIGAAQLHNSTSNRIAGLLNSIDEGTALAHHSRFQKGGGGNDDLSGSNGQQTLRFPG